MIQEIKKLGLKINSLGRKIEEAERAGMATRIPDYIEQMQKVQEKFSKCFDELKKEHNVS